MAQPLTLYLAAPRGFCAGVDRAIKIVELALEKWGAPVYVRHEIVHNRFVVDGLRAKGAVFVEELDECPPDRPVVFSAHGVPKSVPAEAEARRMLYVDATCPLVSKVHLEAERHHANGLQMVMIGHAGHPEVIGTMGQLPEGAVLLVETPADVAGLAPRDPARLAFITQTTLSVDDTAEIVAALRRRFPAIVGPHKEDICYATTNRQEAVKAMAPKIEALLVIGAPNSSNSQRLVEVGRRAGCGYAQLVQRAADIDWRALAGARVGRDHRRRQRARGAGRGGDRRLPRPLRRHRAPGRDRAGAGRVQGAAGPAREGRMTRVPWPALALGLAGLAPFLYALLLLFSEPGRWPTLGLVPSEPEGGALVLERFGAVVLGFMARLPLGLRERAGPDAEPARCSPRPRCRRCSRPWRCATSRRSPACGSPSALWCCRRSTSSSSAQASRPAYWLSLRLPLTAIVIACLLAGALYG